jgi:MarC family membrane protein
MIVLSTTILLFLVLDPIGNIPAFQFALQNVPPSRHGKIILRELLIALFALILFLFFGSFLLQFLQISRSSLGIAGGIILFLIAIKMVFPAVGQTPAPEAESEPFIVPLAIPLVAGPSAMAILMLLTAKDPHNWPYWLLALVLAWFLTGIILLMANKLMDLLGKRMVTAFERLMGLILTAIAVEMFLQGLKDAF